MKKLLMILIVGVLVISGIGTQAISVEKTNNISAETITEIIEIDFSSLTVADSDNDYVTVCLGDDELYLMNPGQPMIPRVLKKFELPFGATNIKIEAEPSEIQELTISKEIIPASAPLPLTPRLDSIIRSQKDETVYNSDDYYPHAWSSFHIGCGLNGDAKRVTHLTVNIFPLRYRPATGRINVATKVDIKITYEKPDTDVATLRDAYDLVIITPSKFSTDAQRLADHKNSFGMNTIVKTTEDIYDEFSGVDKPEQIKYFIKDAIETWNVTYVLLFGGLKSVIWGNAQDDTNQGSKGWHLPVRYSNFQWDGAESYNFTSGEPNYISDLYYADIYKEGGVFDNWYSNGNGIFAEWSGDLREELDLYPDVAFGRLA